MNYGTIYNGLSSALKLVATDAGLKNVKVDQLRERCRKIRKEFIPEEVRHVISDPDGKFIVAFSGGKDSVAMYLYLRFGLKIPNHKIELWHHEIDGNGKSQFDWPCTPSYCQAFADAFNVDLLFSYRQGGIVREIYRENEGLQDVYFQDETNGKYIRLKSNPGNTTKRRFPAVHPDLSRRWCSSVVKIDVMSRAVNNSPRFKEGNFIVCSGERREESNKRSSYPEIEKYRSKTKKRNIWQWRPVLDWTESEVWEQYAKYKIQPHPCYELGYSRCSCFTCIFLSANGWASTYEIDPSKVDGIGEIEKDIEFTLYNDMSIQQKVSAGTSFVPTTALLRWRKEALSLFASPIILDTWSIPAGAFGKESAGSI
jgi:3'-phosphoadenosine 5'-phosphosulfate sulfotransferase (PAPS reductase)/FAD synthetase